MNADTWTVAEAKAKFSEVIEKARMNGPQTVTRNGRAAVVVVSAEEWARKTRRKGSLATFLAESPLSGSGLAESPLSGSGLDLARLKDEPREIEL
jgi:prevent-host-death family protein